MENTLTTKLLVLSLSGKSKVYSLPEDGSIDLSQITSDFEGEPFMFSVSKPEEAIQSVEGESRVAEFIVPPIPKPSSPTSATPPTSDEVIISTTPYYKSGDYALNGNMPVNVCSKDGKMNLPAFNKTDKGPVKAWVSPDFPTQKIQYVRYWENTFSTVLAPGQTFTHESETKSGMEKVHEESFSAELGVEVKGLSAKLSYTTKDSITISESTTIKKTYNLPISDKTCVWTLWQLIEKFIFVDDNDKPIYWSGNYMANSLIVNVTIPSTFNNTFINRLNNYFADTTNF